MELINIKDVNVKYPNGVYAIKDFSVSIKKGDFVFVIGKTGSGKSTFIKMLYREVKPFNGEIILSGLNVAKLKNNKVYKIRRKLGVIFQDYRLLEKLTVFENVAFALEVVGTEKKKIQPKVLKALEVVGLKNKTRSFPTQLSGGEQQRVAIARAIVNSPKLLICDEPTGNLDPEKSMEIMDILNNINKTLGTTIIMATHDKAIVNSMKKRVLVIKNGKLSKDSEKGVYNDADL
jgi:cell division ATP-binding protein ftsE